MKLFLQFLYSIFIRISNCYSHIKCNIRSNIFDYTRIQQSFIKYPEKNIHPYLQLLVSMISSSTIQYIQGKAWWKYSKMEYHLSIDTSISKPLPVRPETIPHFGIHSKNLANHHQLPFFSARHHLSATVSVCLNWSTPIDRNPCSHSDKPVNLISVNPEMRARARVCVRIIQAYTRRSSVYIEQEEREYRSSERRLCFSIRRTKPESWGRVCEETNSTCTATFLALPPEHLSL